MKTIFSSLELFSMSGFKARSNCIHFSHKKKLTSNHSKPIGVLTRTKSPCSDERLPIGYLLSDFQQNRSNFLNRFTSVHFSLNQAERGSTRGDYALQKIKPQKEKDDFFKRTLQFSREKVTPLNFLKFQLSWALFKIFSRPNQNLKGRNYSIFP